MNSYHQPNKMQPSPRYQHDSAVLQSDTVREYLDKHFLYKLENLTTHNPKLLVVFSGGNGVGKSHLARRIKQDLQALVIENDAIKDCLIAWKPNLDRQERNKLTWQYSMDIYKRLNDITTNGLVVRDGVIDWYCDRILPVFEKQGYALFVVAFDVSEQKQRELITARGDKPAISVEQLLLLAEDHSIHTARFRKAHKPDITLTDTDLFEYDKVIAGIKDRLKSI